MGEETRMPSFNDFYQRHDFPKVDPTSICRNNGLMQFKARRSSCESFIQKIETADKIRNEGKHGLSMNMSSKEHLKSN